MDEAFAPRRRKGLIAAVAVACLCAASICGAQEVALPEASPSAQPELPAAAATPAATVPPPPQLIPADILPMPDPSAPPTSTPAGPTLQELDEALKPKSISQAAENYRLHIEWRKLRNQAQNDPKVKAAFAATEHTRTDFEKRERLADYVNVLFDKEIALGAPEMKNYLNDRRREFMSALPQPRVRPQGTATPERKRKRDAAAGLSSPPPASELPVATPVESPARDQTSRP